MVKLVAKITQHNTWKCFHWKTSNEASNDKKYTNTKLPSFIICKKAMEECKYAVFVRINWTANMRAIGITPYMRRDLSMLTLCAGSVKDGNHFGWDKKRIEHNVAPIVLCMKTSAVGYGNLPTCNKYLLKVIKPAEHTM